MNNVTSQPFLPEAWAQARMRISDMLRDFGTAINQAANLQLFKVVSTAAAYTAGTNDHVIKCTSGPYTVTLPAAGDMREKKVTVKRADSGTSTITIATAAGNIDGGATATLTTAYQARTLYSDGVQWWLI